MRFLNDLPELIKAGIIDEDTAARIRRHYETKPNPSANRLLIAFGVLGAILVGLGVVLVVAHNWDDFPKPIKTAFAFLPLVTGQVICGYTLWRKRDSVAWREASSVFVMFGVAASISLVSQIYNIPGDIGSFLLTWMILSIPLIYAMNSSATSLLCLAGVTWFVCETEYWRYPSGDGLEFPFLFAACIPHYYFLLRNKPASNFTSFHNWFVPLSAIIGLGVLETQHEEWFLLAYMSLFGVIYLIGHGGYFEALRIRSNGFKVLGSAGTVVLLLILSFDEIWEDLRREPGRIAEGVGSPEFIGAILLTAVAGIFLGRRVVRDGVGAIAPVSWVFLLFVPVFFLGFVSTAAVVITNVLIFVVAVLTIREGAHRDHLGILNYGLIIIAALVTCRFFDTDLSFIARGVLFITVGAGFFGANYWMLQKRKAHA